MLKKFIKTIALMLTVTIILASFAGCSKGTSTAGEGVKQGKQAEQAPGSGIKFPITDRKIVLNYWSALPARVASVAKSLEEVAVYQELEKRTGIKINFMHAAVGQEKDQFNLMIAANDLPDIIFYNWPTISGGPEKYISDNIILSLNKYTDKYAPNYTKLLAENLEAKKEVETDEGNIYMFSFFRMDPVLKTYKGLQIREDWLKKLNLKVPENLDDWYNVLKAFREKDANGNGKQDELPFISQKMGDGIYSFLYAYGVIPGFYQENGIVKYGPIEPAFKDALTFLKKLYEEKLIDNDYALTDAKQFDAKIAGNLAGAFYGSITGSMEKYMSLMKDKDPNFSLIGVPNIKGPDGKRTVISNSFTSNSTGLGAAVTSRSKNTPEAIQWLDYLYGEEGHMLANFGIEGSAYKMENGSPKYTDEILKNPKGLSISDALGKYVLAATDAPIVQDPRYLGQIMLYPQQKPAIDAWKKEIYLGRVMPRVTPTQEESTRFASIMNDVNTYSNGMISKFIMGSEPFDNYDKFVKQIKQLNIDEAIKIQQAALDRYNKRK